MSGDFNLIGCWKSPHVHICVVLPDWLLRKSTINKFLHCDWLIGVAMYKSRHSLIFIQAPTPPMELSISSDWLLQVPLCSLSPGLFSCSLVPLLFRPVVHFVPKFVYFIFCILLIQMIAFMWLPLAFQVQ